MKLARTAFVFDQSNQRAFSLFFSVCLCLVLMGSQTLPFVANIISSLRVIMLQGIISVEAPLRERTHIVERLESYSTLQQKILRYELRVRDLEGKLATFEELKKENEALRSQFASSSAQARFQIPTRLVQLSASSFITVGERDGVRRGSPLFWKNSFIGLVTMVQPWSSAVELLTDDGMNWGVKHQKTGELGILSTKHGRTTVVFLSRRDDIAVGDMLITTGQPDGVPDLQFVGTVDQVLTKPSDPVSRVLVQLPTIPTGDSLVVVENTR